MKKFTRWAVQFIAFVAFMAVLGTVVDILFFGVILHQHHRLVDTLVSNAALAPIWYVIVFVVIPWIKRAPGEEAER